ncbi:hypothetical protein GDO86_017542 [Hymenochirus boettgeri]|uniref:Uncharacterized protein n=1 Tax=Hymenochirus boettgeri TaxID=247094 RepID=A0A8T2INB9_9PIPI|nr:hypothetical protein GDO86_017542 [Hymenochirus boettgeri]
MLFSTAQSPCTARPLATEVLSFSARRFLGQNFPTCFPCENLESIFTPLGRELCLSRYRFLEKLQQKSPELPRILYIIRKSDDV